MDTVKGSKQKLQATGSQAMDSGSSTSASQVGRGLDAWVSLNVFLGPSCNLDGFSSGWE